MDKFRGNLETLCDALQILSNGEEVVLDEIESKDDFQQGPRFLENLHLLFGREEIHGQEGLQLEEVSGQDEIGEGFVEVFPELLAVALLPQLPDLVLLSLLVHIVDEGLQMSRQVFVHYNYLAWDLLNVNLLQSSFLS